MVKKIVEYYIDDEANGVRLFFDSLEKMSAFANFREGEPLKIVPLKTIEHVSLPYEK